MTKYRLRLLLLRALAWLARPLARPLRAAPARVLYIKPDHLGDLLLATPALAALRARWPAAHLTALVGPWARVVLQRNPDVDQVLECPFPGFTRAARGARGPRTLARPYLSLLRYGLLLRRQRYDIALIGRDDHWWGAALALLAGVPVRVGFAVPECRPFLTTALAWDPHAHVTAQGLALIAAAGPTPAPPSGPAAPPARFDPAPDDRAWAARWLGERGLLTTTLAVIHPGTGGPAKLWRAERWAQVVDALHTDGVAVVITGGPGEEGLVAEVVRRAKCCPPHLAGQTSLGQLAALQRRAALVLGVDSGPLHLAAAQGVPTLHLYGPGDAGRFGPWGDPRRHTIMRAELWCSPCGVFGACPRGLVQPECMEQIEVERVVTQARRALTAARLGS